MSDQRDQRDQRIIEVVADWASLGRPVLMGRLTATPARGKEVFAFEYDAAWLSSGSGQQLDPSLQLYGGPQYPGRDRENFGVFLDSSPDRWGRVLMRRREAQLARAHGRAQRRLLESDYLLGVHDGHRMGALRFRVDGVFLDDNDELASPPWTSLRDLQHASLQLEREGVENDIGAWEHLIHDLAQQAGVAVPSAELHRFGTSRSGGHGHHTHLSRRFDGHGRRPAAPLRVGHDVARPSRRRRRRRGCELSRARRRADPPRVAHLRRPAAALARIVFSICVSNTDDHLGNHGFMLGPSGWALAPAYDMNPDPDGSGLTLNISESDNAQDLGLAMDVASVFRVNAPRAREIVDEVTNAVKRWRSVASAQGLSRAAQDRVHRAFRVAEAWPGG